MYIYLIKYAITASALFVILWQIYTFGYNNAEANFNAELARANDLARIENDKIAKELHELKLKSESDNEIAQAQINELSFDLAAKLNNPGVQHRKVCSEKRVSKNSNTEVSAPAEAESELSKEFREFLLSEFKRADQVRSMLEEASDWSNDLCKSGVAICE